MQTKKTNILIQIVTVLTFLCMIFVNALSAILPINGMNPGEISDSYPNLFAPAGITFSIWSVIYLFLALHTIFQLGFFCTPKKCKHIHLLRRIDIVFSLSSLINIAWIFAWHYHIIPLSMIFMVLLLLCLIYINLAFQKHIFSTREIIFMQIPFRIYFGWIIVATIANMTVLLVSFGFHGILFPESVWAILVLLVGVAIGITTMFKLQTIIPVIVLIWAYIGILIKHTTVFQNQYINIIVTTIICLILYICAIIFYIFKSHQFSSPSSH